GRRRMRFQYRAATPEGRMIEGVLQAPSSRTALEQLRRQRLYPVDLARVGGEPAQPRSEGLARAPAVALFARTVATLLGAGVPLDRALSFGADQARHPELAA